MSRKIRCPGREEDSRGDFRETPCYVGKPCYTTAVPLVGSRLNGAKQVHYKRFALTEGRTWGMLMCLRMQSSLDSLGSREGART
jgi:hypothetical protein